MNFFLFLLLTATAYGLSIYLALSFYGPISPWITTGVGILIGALVGLFAPTN